MNKSWKQSAAAWVAGRIFRSCIGSLLIVVSTTAGAQTASADFQLKNNDVVAFFGDSNTEWGSYVRDMENYTLLRFPERNIRFINAGFDGDMVSKAYFRLDRDVFKAGATVAIVMFGINDMSWGNYGGPEYQKTFLEYTRKVIDECFRHHVRVYVVSYPITDRAIGMKGADRYNRFVGDLTSQDTSLLQRLGDSAMKIARERGAAAIDVEREMRAMRNAFPPGTRLHQDDGVHLNELGNEILAYVLLKGLHAPPLVSSVSIDAERGKAVRVTGATVSNVTKSGDTIRFTRLDRGLPLTFWKPVDSSGVSVENLFAPVNGYFVSFAGLNPHARYELGADGIALSPPCGFDGSRLSEPLNLAALRSDRWLQRGPWAQQAMALGRLTESKADLHRALVYRARTEEAGSNWNLMTRLGMSALTSISAVQRSIAKPVPYHFTLSPLSSDSVSRCTARGTR
ncbi:MAG: SGNH/GDSL hydrolase family protein [Gemmatimonadaceae bacterium]